MGKTEIDSIEYRERFDLNEQIYLFFYTWKQTQGKNASISQLMSGLKKARLLRCFEQIENFIRSKVDVVYSICILRIQCTLMYSQAFDPMIYYFHAHMQKQDV